MDPLTSELHDDPAFEPGDKVAAVRAIRNDGTHPAAAIGQWLVEAGDVGYVKSVGTYLNCFHVYAVDFVDRGVLVGMRRHELELLEAAP